MRGLVADSKASCTRTLGLCLEKRVGLITLVPRTCAVRQELATWGQQQDGLPLLLEKPGRTRQEAPRRWHGRRVTRPVAVEYADGRLAVEELRFLPVTLVHFAVDNTPLLQVHGIQDYHRIVCEAVGIDHAWYQGAAAGQNSPLSTTPP
jgi:hypothetical protein